VEKHCLTADMAKHLGCNVTTMRRYLRRVELLGLVVEAQGHDVKLWELTDVGMARLQCDRRA
jgi:DNA-binding transcriptional regulator YhcF (GntR family)